MCQKPQQSFASLSSEHIFRRKKHKATIKQLITVQSTPEDPEIILDIVTQNMLHRHEGK